VYELTLVMQGFTVVSIDLEAHGFSGPDCFVLVEDFERMVTGAYEIIQHQAKLCQGQKQFIFGEVITYNPNHIPGI
jgi:alpha-beta hydrolase superfamily lysophospholipase